MKKKIAGYRKKRRRRYSYEFFLPIKMHGERKERIFKNSKFRSTTKFQMKFFEVHSKIRAGYLLHQFHKDFEGIERKLKKFRNE